MYWDLNIWFNRQILIIFCSGPRVLHLLQWGSTCRPRDAIYSVCSLPPLVQTKFCHQLSQSHFIPLKRSVIHFMWTQPSRWSNAYSWYISCYIVIAISIFVHYPISIETTIIREEMNNLWVQKVQHEVWKSSFKFLCRITILNICQTSDKTWGWYCRC